MITAETVNRILRFDSGGLPVVSLYARIEPGASRRELHTRVSSLLDEVRQEAKDGSVNRDARMSLRGDLARIRDALGEEHWNPGAVAIFACGGRGLYTEVPLPQPVADRVIVDATPHAHPMITVLEEHERCCVALIDRTYARLWEFYQDEVRELEKIRDAEVRKSAYPTPLDEYRVRNKADELSKKHYRNVAEVLRQLLDPGGFDALVIGGHDYEVPRFIQQLPAGMRGRVAGTFSADPGTATSAEVRASAAAIAERHERELDQQRVAALLEKNAMGGLATLGLQRCLWAGSIKGIESLLLRDGLSAEGVVCDESGWLAADGDTCPLCGKPTRRTPDVVNELVQAVISESGSVHHIDADSRLRAFDMGAELRFPLPHPPTVQE